MSNENKRRHGPPPGKGMNPGEKPKNLKAAISRLTNELGKFKTSILISLLLAGLSAVLALASPNIISDLTDEISKGLVINTKNAELLQKDILTNLEEKKLKIILNDILNLELNDKTIYKVNSSKINNNDKKEFNKALKNISNNPENTIKYIGELPDTVLSVILNNSTYNNIKVTKEDKILLIKTFSNINLENNNFNFINNLPYNINKILFPDSVIDGITVTTDEKLAFINTMSNLNEESTERAIYYE